MPSVMSALASATNSRYSQENDKIGTIQKKVVWRWKQLPSAANSTATVCSEKKTLTHRSLSVVENAIYDA